MKIPLEITQNRHQKLTDLLPENSAILLLSNSIQIRNGDNEHKFYQDSNFWYFTGINEPDSAFLIVKTNQNVETTVFIRPNNKEKEAWTGLRFGLENAKNLLNADRSFSFYNLETEISKLIHAVKTIYFDFELESNFLIRQKLTQSFNQNGILNLKKPDEIISDLRLFKEPYEIEQMQTAANITVNAHKNVLNYIKEGNFEYQIEAKLESFFRENNGNIAYPSIVASGENATILHYNSNNSILKQGDLLLIDAASEYNYYASDVTRTYAVDGVYTEAQTEIYNIVLKAQKASILKAGQNNATFKDVHLESVKVISQGLLELGILNGNLDEIIDQKQYFPYFMHGTSHWIGLDVHDIGSYFEPQFEDSTPKTSRILKPGMALTIEPGLYFKKDDETVPAKYRGIGIRIEDDVVITENGVLNLTQRAEK